MGDASIYHLQHLVVCLFHLVENGPRNVQELKHGLLLVMTPKLFHLDLEILSNILWLLRVCQVKDFARKIATLEFSQDLVKG